MEKWWELRDGPDELPIGQPHYTTAAAIAAAKRVAKRYGEPVQVWQCGENTYERFVCEVWG